MKLDSDDFEMFGLPRRFALERSVVDSRWRELQAEVHPDRFATVGAAAQRVAMQWAIRVNEAHDRLKDPLRRAAYLCELHGTPIDAETNTSMPPTFLVQQMEWREALDEARGVEQVRGIAGAVAQHRVEALARLALAIDTERDFTAAAAQVRALMFVERFAEDVDQRLEALGQ
jgi:molecular chaperone HscB